MGKKILQLISAEWVVNFKKKYQSAKKSRFLALFGQDFKIKALIIINKWIHKKGENHS